MIPEIFIQAWRKNVEWQMLAQIEQDLIISRALVDLYNDPHVSETLVFRGGAALNKLSLKPPSRYSEDSVPRGTKEFADEIKFHNQIN